MDATASILHRLLTVTIGPVSDPLFEALQYSLRKTAHIVSYAILSALDFRAIRAGRTGWTVRWSALAVALAVLVGVLDEVHQSMIRSRTGLPSDVVIDFLGAMLAQVVWRRAAALHSR